MEISILPSDIINILADLKKIRQVSKRNTLLKKKCGMLHKMHYPKDDYLGKYQKYRIEKKINEVNLIYLIVHLKEVVLLTILAMYPKFASEHQFNKEFYSLPYLLNFLIKKMHHLPKLENLKSETTNVRGGATNVRGGATNVRGGPTSETSVRGGATSETSVRGGAKENKNKFGNNLNNELENYFESNDMDASQKLRNRQRKSATTSKNDSSEYELNDDTYINTDYESSAFHRQLLQQQKLLRQLDRLKYMKKLKNKDVQLLSNQLTSIEKMLEGADLTKIIPTVGDEPIPSRFKTVVDGVDLREIPNEKREQFLQIIKRKTAIDARIEQLRKQKDSLALLNNSENKSAKIAKVKEEATQLKQERDVILGQIKQMKNEKKQQIQKLRDESEKENSAPLFTKKFGSLAHYNQQNENEESQNDTEYLSFNENATQTNAQPNNLQAAANSVQAKANNSQRSVQPNNSQAAANSAQAKANNSQAAANSAQAKANNSQRSVQANNLQAAANSAQANNSQTNNLQPTNVNVKSQNQKEEIKRPRKPEKEQIVEVFTNINKLREHYQRGVILFRRLVGLIIYDKHLHMIVTYISNNWDTLKTQIYDKIDLYNRSLNLYNIISNKNKIIMSDLKKAVDENRKEYMQLLNSEILPFVSEDSEYILTENSLHLVEPIFNQVNTEFNSIKAHYGKLRDQNDIQNYKIMDVETYDIVQPSAKLFRDFAILANINADEGTGSLASVTPSINSSKLYTNLKSKFSNQKQNTIKVNEPASTVEEITTTANVTVNDDEDENEFNNARSQFLEEEGNEQLKLGEDEGEEDEDEGEDAETGVEDAETGDEYAETGDEYAETGDEYAETGDDVDDSDNEFQEEEEEEGEGDIEA